MSRGVELLRVLSAACALGAAGLLVLPALGDAARRAPRAVERAASDAGAADAPEAGRPTPRTVSVLAKSRPPGASVRVDGDDRGRTPAIFDVRCQEGSSFAVEIALEGHRTHRVSAACAPGSTLEVDARLEPTGR